MKLGVKKSFGNIMSHMCRLAQVNGGSRAQLLHTIVFAKQDDYKSAKPVHETHIFCRLLVQDRPEVFRELPIVV